MRAFDRYRFNPYSKISYDFIGGTNNKFDGYMYIVTNYRVLVENNWLDDLQYLCSPTELHEKRYTMRFTCSRAIAQELTRHRVFSFLMESQRYINYSKERHGGEITFIIPSWFQTLNEEGDYKGEIRDGSNRVVLGGRTFQLASVQGFDEHYMCSKLAEAENAYFHFLKQGYTPQQARDVLPNATKTELIMTGFSSDWKHLFDLRLFEKTGAVHPDMLDLMQKALGAMQVAGIWKDIMSNPSKFD
jgi:thymidylate synthase (FAD)